MKIIGKPLGEVYKAVDEFSKDIGDITSGPLNKAWRLKILYNRRTSGKEQASQSNQPDVTTQTTKDKREVREVDIYEREAVRKSSVDSQASLEITQPFNAANQRQGITRDNIYIIPRDSIGDMVTLQTIPKEVRIDTDSNIAVIPSIGRNNPFYNFTGSEDTITFEVTWYANEESREDVIRNCEMLRSFTKGDGYDKSLPILYLKWSGNDTLFKDDSFIMASANYRMGLFIDSYSPSNTNEVVKVGLLPTQATQEITLRRVTSNNLKWEDIRWKNIQ